eukprot:scaffold7139_cov115-Cylindrotheca_fusiformis.AAC.17
MQWAGFLLQLFICWTYASSSVSGNRVAFLPTFSNRSNRQRRSNSVQSLQKQYSAEDGHLQNILSEKKLTELQSLVEERSKARWEGNYARADFLREQIQNVELPKPVAVVVTDIPRKEGGGSSWKLVSVDEHLPLMEGQTVLQLAHAALGLAVESSVKANLDRAHMAIGNGHLSKVDEGRNETLASIVQQAKMRLCHTSWTDTELSGRKSADAAFWFALAGVTDTEIFQLLVDVATREISRFGDRPSCRSKDIFQIMERFSAAGVQKAPKLERIAEYCLSAKDESLDGVHSSPLLNFHSDRSLLLIWKFSTKQKKQRAFLQSALKHWQRGKEESETDMQTTFSSDSPQILATNPNQAYDWERMFKDPTRPLVVDLGCGMGISLLGLARGDHQPSAKVLLDHQSNMTWGGCNFIGVDLGGLGIGYAAGIASRWGINGHIQFVVDSAESLVKALHSYPGSVSLCLIQFPTPYQLNSVGEASDMRGNSQLPRSACDGFMVTEDLLQLVYESLSETNGRLLLQSNCEDVAVYMRNLASNSVGFYVENVDQDIVQSQSAAFPSSGTTQRNPKRTADWVLMGGERAEGPGWSKKPILHRDGATKTEVACALNGTPVHRCVLRLHDR